MGVTATCKSCRAEARKPGIHEGRAAKQALSARGEKRCGSCGQVKPLTAFHVRRASNDGLAYKCAECIKAACRDWRADHPGAFKKWHSENLDARRAYWRDWSGRNKKHLAKSYAAWAKKNPHVLNAIVAKRRAAKFRATPKWADLDAIRAIYAEAARLTLETGIRHEVDHIYPIQGVNVCGLHCEANLQILTKTENIRKGNRMPEEIASG